MGRTYLPKLLSIVHRLCVYVTRYDAQIREYLEPDEIAPYEALRTSCAAFLVAVDIPEGD